VFVGESHFQAELDEEPVWRQLLGELFRIPPRSDLLGAMVGVGLQLCCLSVCFHILAFIGVYYTGNRLVHSFLFFWKHADD
jgi:hypothetical protein